MKLDELLTGLEVIEFQGGSDMDITSVGYDSRKIGPGALFVAVRGLKTDGHGYIDEALKRGAAAIVHDQPVTARFGTACIRVKDSRLALSRLGRNFYRNPSRELCLIGVTGTNGKTTFSYLLESILKAAGSRTGVIGTVNYRYGDKVLPAPNTTPESFELQRILREMADAGVNHVILEVSSHSLDLGRVDDCHFALGVFTNLTPEHLDYHISMESYYEAKRRFFEIISRQPPSGLFNMLVNRDDPWGERLYNETGQGVLGFGIENSWDFFISGPKLTAEGIRAGIVTPMGEFFVHSTLAGKFNLYNILAASAAANMLQVPDFYIQSGIMSVKSVPGRLEKVSAPQQTAVYIDYAHTEDALERVLQNLSNFKTGRIITVFGCGGDRDRGKRPRMGRIATAYSDLTVVTSDNPRTEDPLEIIRQIEQGINGVKKLSPEDLQSQDKKGYVVVPDRRKAIELAISTSDSSDTILIAGKGHENYQILGTKTVPFDDRLISRELLERHQGRKG